MKRIKYSIREIYLAIIDILNSTDAQNKKIRRELLRFFMGIAIASFGISMAVQEFRLNNRNTYEDWDYTASTGLSTIRQSIEHNEQVTIVLHRTGCRACAKAEKDITKQLITTSQMHPTERLIVMDLKDMNSKQLRQLGHLMPNIITPNGIPTPLVANAKPKSKHLELLEFSDSNNTQKINQVFASIK